CIDIDEKKIEGLKNGVIPIYEPGLKELVLRNFEAGRLHFTTDTPEGVKPAEMVYLAVGTPQGDDGAADLSAMWAVTKAIAPHLREDAIVVTKSTVPVGTNAKIFSILKEITGRDCDVASNPEFLKEGAAIDDFMKPDRVVVGVRRSEVSDKLEQLYSPFLRTEKPFLSMSPESAEMTKYVANALLATKISFINEMANLCEKMGGDINDVRRGIGHDSRIGFAFLFPGVGYGGSCFPKDVRALTAMTEDKGNIPEMLKAVDSVNERQKTVLFDKVKSHYGDLAGKRIALWGLAFKPETDDVREAPALVLIKQLQEAGATVLTHDPEAMENVAAETEGVEFCKHPFNAIEGAHGLCICTDWKAYHQPDFAEMYQLMKDPVVFDGRNLYDPVRMARRGYCYHSIGRPMVDGRNGNG
ncbi:MAG: UDP-glucose/GDP-mannose dehydrogenase family protein, partial [Planctomycetota bacterium]